ncbi:MAG: hypothetical protein ACRDOU_18835 [Streptosporangiaceae bacterium]
MPVFSRPRREMSGAVRPAFSDPRFALLVAGQAVNSIGGWASAIVLWGFAAYRFDASPGAVSVTIICWAAPPALLSPLLGVSIDRIGPKTATVTGYLGAAGRSPGPSRGPVTDRAGYRRRRLRLRPGAGRPGGQRATPAHRGRR